MTGKGCVLDKKKNKGIQEKDEKRDCRKEGNTEVIIDMDWKRDWREECSVDPGYCRIPDLNFSILNPDTLDF